MAGSWRRRIALSSTLVLLVLGVGNPAAAGSRSASNLSRLADVSCPTVSSCLAVGTSRTGQAVVVATTDAGATWAVEPSPPGVETLATVECWAAQRCLVGGSGFGDAGALYRTVDGGQSWHVQPAVVPGGFFITISCHTHSLCLAGGPFGFLFRSVDAGRTWDEQRRADVSLSNAIDCVTVTVCELAGYSGQGSTTGVALRSTDGGQSWVRKRLPETPSFPQGLDCVSIENCLAVGDGSAGGGRTEARAVVTHDGGATWQRLTLPSGYAGLSAVACWNSRSCEAVGLGPTGMLGTVDGGRTWTPQGPPTVFGRSVTCPAPSICVAVGETQSGAASIHRTDDGGRHWVRQLIG